MRSGETLRWDGDYLLTETGAVVKFSQKCRNELERLIALGYRITRAEIRFVKETVRSRNDAQ